MIHRLVVGALIGGAFAVVLDKLLGRKKGAATRDFWTLAGLLTWRPLRRNRAFIAAAVLLLWAGAQHDWLVTAAVIAIAMYASAVLGLHVTERPWRRSRVVADAFLLACVDSGVRGGGRRLLRSPYPTPTKASTHGENVTLTVRIPPGMDITRLADAATIIATHIPHCQQVAIRPSAVEPANLAEVDIAFTRLQGSHPVNLVEAPAREDRLTLGYGVVGPVEWDLDNETGLAIYGATGAGKGVLTRWLVTQALDPTHGRCVVIIDGQGSPEWTPFVGLANVQVVAFDAADPMGSLERIEQALRAVVAHFAAMAAFCKKHDADSWAKLPDHIKANNPRWIIFADEITALLAKTNDDTAKVRKTIGHLLGIAYRTIRKGGICFCHVDQITYADSYLADGALGQLRRWVVLGRMDNDTARMATGLGELPYMRDAAGRVACTGVICDAFPTSIGIPDVDRATVHRTLTTWSTTNNQPNNKGDSHARN